tara:strand:+ start:145 stop:684 length:540 start_codon:yes stop_codon:yes gene_type:complete
MATDKKPFDVELIGKIWNNAAVKKIFDDSIEDWLLEWGTQWQSNIRKRTPVGVTGNLRRATTLIEVPRGGPVREVRITNALVYALPVEAGSKPHALPRHVIEQDLSKWVLRVLGIRGPKKRRSVAYAIAHKIKTKGTKNKTGKSRVPAEMFELATQQLLPLATRDLGDIVDAIVTKLNG